MPYTTPVGKTAGVVALWAKKSRGLDYRPRRPRVIIPSGSWEFVGIFPVAFQ